MGNKGLEYEEQIKLLLGNQKLFTPALMAQCKQTENDAGFIHKGKNYFLELKNRTAPDYGSAKIIYNTVSGKWKWNDADDITQVFDKFKLLTKAKTFVPRKYTKDDSKLTEKDKDFDRRRFENKVTEEELTLSDLGLSGAALIHQYYAKKNCFYLQVEGKGFYHLLNDPANLGVPQFKPSVTFRFRAKTHGSKNIANYSFRIVLKVPRGSITDSNYDLEDKSKIQPF